MDKKAIAEVRKLLTRERCRIDSIAGCFVDEDGQIIAELNETWRAMQEEETAKYLELFRRTLTGRTGRNLFEMEFPLAEEADGGKQAQLYALLRSELADPERVRDFCRRIMGSIQGIGRYLIVLAFGSYDIPAKTSDGQELEDASDYVYQFMVCDICPVTEIREGLCFDAQQLRFVNKRSDLGVQMPAVGFVYPAFTDRIPDIHSLMYYARKEEERHPELIDELIGTETELPATETEEKELFTGLVEKALGRGCDFDSVKALTEAAIETVKQQADAPEPAELGRTEIRRILRESGSENTREESFEEAFDAVWGETVGEGKGFKAESIAPKTTMEIRSPSIRISVKSDMSSMITTRILDGREFLLIPLQDDVELNGVRILSKRISDETD
ncbi:DUF4317 domain-containing protein [Lachnoclostridium sp. Marseille-P6806]|uniref:DUF4317 domain-containing protein n=1 Tax=Lachnoclostridium sp. Marseille-P6806 TaxID=2364793 RepID=UPI001031DDB0|nr:DUF4317 domain-containing protein [Lachnoclostridium sp. Marseille-P6806]